MINRARFRFETLYRTQHFEFGSYLLFQVGDLSCEPGYVVETHEQIVYEISYVVSGKGIFIVNGQRYPVKRGTVFINTIGDIHTIESAMDDPLRFMYIGFDFRGDTHSNQTLCMLSDFYKKPVCRIRDDLFDVQEGFITLLSEFMAKDELTDSLKECYIHSLLCQVYRLMTPKMHQSYQLKAGDRTDCSALVYDIAHYMDENIGTITNLRILCDVFGYSYTYLASTFSSIMKQSLSKYMNKRKFEKACDYLAKGISVTDTAQLLGYQTIHAFSHAFKQHTGINPSTYQSNVSINTDKENEIIKGEAHSE